MNALPANTAYAVAHRAVGAPATVFVVDDDVSIRESVEALIRHEGFDVRSFVSANAFLGYPPTHGPGCLILDIQLPGLTGLELQQSLVIDRPAMPIIFITGQDDTRTVVTAMKAGAVEFLAKPFDDDMLLGAVRAAIARSETLVIRETHKSILKTRYGRLTRRERDVFPLIAEGFLNREIGEQLGISEITVKAHRGQLMRKMEAESFAELLRMAEAVGV
ncbi:response regulator transcription factor [Paraburkholderia sp. ZP32-5]|uniref:response regulator transcription factor n=1 Tax=Paraburkholderia sp. ZP32-5 TaxID=2883245 RepID=UPI001F2AAEC3|nr:response regulator [Paraburkholderia sp. ZP32-5]